MGKAKKKVEALVFASSQSPEAFKLSLREAVHAKGDMLCEETEAGFDLGIERGGHSGGYWYVATVNETEDGTEMRGEIVYRSLHGDGSYREETKWEKLKEKLFIVMVGLLCLIPILIAYAVWGVMVLIGKLRKKSVKLTMTTEEKLTHFMTEVMGCDIIE